MAKTSPAQFVREVRNEFKKIQWPARKEASLSTLMVFVMVAFMGVFFLVVDQIISYLIKMILG